MVNVPNPGQTPGTKPTREGYPKQKQKQKNNGGGNGKGGGHNGSGGGNGNGGGLGGRRYGAYGGFPGVRYADALALVNAGLKPEIRQVRNDIQKTRREAQLERQRARNHYQSAVGDLNHVFGESGDYIGFQNQAIQQNYDALEDRAQQAQAALLDHLQANGAANAGAANAELERLGIQGSGDMGQFAADQSNIENVAQVTGANNLANISAAQSNASDVGNLLLGMNAGSKASALGQQVSDRNDAFFEAEATKKVAVEQLRRTMSDLRKSRPDLVRQMLEQLRQSGWGQYMDLANLHLQRDQLNLQRQAQQFYQNHYNSGGSSYSSYGSSGSSGGGPGDSASSDDASMDAYNQLALDDLNHVPGSGGKKKK